MPEKTIPWWRRALSFALGSLRSGFGLFPRVVRPVLVTGTRASDDFKEIPEEGKALTEPFPQSEEVDDRHEAPVEVEPVPFSADATKFAPESMQAAEPVQILATEDEETGLVDTIAAESEPEPEEDAGEEQATSESEAEPEPEAVSLPAAEAEEAAEVVQISVLAVESEAEDESTLEPILEVEPVAVAEIADDAEPAPIDATESAPGTDERRETVNEVVEEIAEEAVPVAEVEPVVEPEVSQVQDTSELSETIPEPIEELEPEPEPEPELVTEAVPEVDAEPAPDTTTEQAAPLVEQQAAVEPEPELVTEAVPEVDAEPAPDTTTEQATPLVEQQAAVEPEPVTEPIAEAASASDGALQMVLIAEPSAEEKSDEKAAEKAAAKLAARQKKLDEGSEESPFSVIVGQVYDGPLDLLLDLIRKQDIDIYDIPIATITSQFLAYVNQLKAGDVDVAGEFIYTASMLIHIKSKMLLPRTAMGPEDAGEDPRRELVERLLEHERFKNAAQMLQQKQMLEAATWSNPGVREFKDDEGAEPEIAADTVDLVRIFRDILERARNRPVINVEEDSVTVGQMIQFLARRLTMEDKPVALRRLLSHTRSERALIAMFLALLEMVRLQAILLRQDRQFSEIFIKKHSGFEAVMNDGLGNARDDWR
jgi:segregation and condensation protein A